MLALSFDIGHTYSKVNVQWLKVTLTFGHKKVEQRNDNRVSTEHVVSTRLDTGQSHPKATPDRQRPLYLLQRITVCLEEQKALVISQLIICKAITQSQEYTATTAKSCKNCQLLQSEKLENII